MKYVATLNGKKYEIEIERVDGRMPLDRGAAAVATAPIIAAAPAPVAAAPAPGAAPAPVAAPAPAAAPAPVAAPAGAGESVNSPMPGTILSVNVNVGDTVAEGQVLMVLEAMKMENEIMAPKAGTVTQVLVSKGSTVDTGAPLVVIG